MDRISSLISKVLSKRGLKDQAGASYITFLAREWICEHLESVQHLILVKCLSEEKLVCECTHSIAAQELMQRSEDLKAFLNSHDSVCVRDIMTIRAT